MAYKRISSSAGFIVPALTRTSFITTSHQVKPTTRTQTICSYSNNSESYEQVESDVVTVTYRGRAIKAQKGERLRDILLGAGTHPHNGGLLITCRGLGTCGTCAVNVQNGSDVIPETRSWREEARLGFPPHTTTSSKQRQLRLACQIRVIGDIRVEKFEGFWGHKEQMLPPLE